MADLNHKSKAELAQQINDLKTQNQSQQIEHDHMKKRYDDKLDAYEKQFQSLQQALKRMGKDLNELQAQRDQARQALVEGTINSNRLVHLVQPQQAVNN